MNSQIPRVFVATDIDDVKCEALQQAHSYAESTGGVLGVCHISPERGSLDYPDDAEAVESCDERVRDRIRATVTSATGRAGGSFEVFVVHGSVYAEIVRLAESWRATLTAVGVHSGTGGLTGGVAERVARYAPCTVLVARPSAGRGVVLCATDLSEPSLPAVATAVIEARRRHAELEVIHVVDQGVPLASVSATEGLTPLVLCPELLHDVREAARAKIEAVLAKLDAHARVTIVEGHAVKTILEHVQERRAELLVVGTRGRTGLARILLGSVAEKLVRTAGVSVLVARLAR